jgi:hypothetical protein
MGHLTGALRGTALLLAGLVFGRTACGAAPSFDHDVRPILSAHCLKCHGERDRKGGLDLRTPASIRHGGTDGPAIVPGAAAQSVLIEQATSGTMPPGKAVKLSAGQIAVLRGWIDAGAKSDQPESAEPVFTAARQHWAFRPLRRPALPAVRDRSRAASPVDLFLTARLEEKGLTYAPEADRPALLRRASLDLIGLPPTPEELDSFLADTSPDAWEKVIDRLLASPHFGERWGRHWLDEAGYVDVMGTDNDAATVKLGANKWLYRDYVVRCFNEDRPFERFLREQLAGDEMVDWRAAKTFTPEIREHLVATGFLRVAPDDTDERELRTQDILHGIGHKTAEVVAGNLLALTVGCAKCHDHKYEPISQPDYYRFLAIFRPALNPEKWLPPGERAVPNRGSADAKEVLQAVYDVAPPTPTRLLRRGNHETPGLAVEPGLFRVLTQGDIVARVAERPVGPTSGRRLALAAQLTDWTSPAGALVARVRVNRIWMHVFGQGLVATPDNLGVTGARPSHPELLDWLAWQFAATGGRLKPLLRQLMTSAAYRQASKWTGPVPTSDPENRLLWRMRLRRLESEIIRDSLLAVSGRLDRTLGGKPVPVQAQPDGTLTVPAEGLPTPTSGCRRSLYLLSRRNYHPTFLAVFDQPVMTSNCPCRNPSAVVSQSLTLLNDRFVLEQADALAERVLRQAGTESARQIEAAYRLALVRQPTSEETARCTAFIDRQQQRSRSSGFSPDAASRDAVAHLCQVLLNTSEFLYAP